MRMLMRVFMVVLAVMRMFMRPVRKLTMLQHVNLDRRDPAAIDRVHAQGRIEPESRHRFL